MLSDMPTISQRLGYGVRVKSVDVLASVILPGGWADEDGEFKTKPLRWCNTCGPCHIYRPSPGLGRVEGPRAQPDSCLQHPIRSLGDKTGVPTFPRTLIGFTLWNELDKSVKGENHVNKHWAVTSPHKDKEA